MEAPPGYFRRSRHLNRPVVEARRLELLVSTVAEELI